MREDPAFLRLGALAIAWTAGLAGAAPGDLDATFGTGGVVQTGGALSADGYEGAFAVAVQSDGKIVVCADAYTGSDTEMAVVRFNTDGTLDTTFDGDGKVVTPIGAGYDFGAAIEIQSDDKIVMTGYFTNVVDDVFIVRYNGNGSLDTSLDGDGKSLTTFGPQGGSPTAISIQADGKIVIAGDYSFALGAPEDGTADNFMVVRYLAITCTDGASCDDSDICTGDGVCQASGCVPGDPLDCTDDSLCTVDSCTPQTGCQNVNEPVPTELCHTAPRAQLLVKANGEAANRLLRWSWAAGSAFDHSDLAEPDVDTNYSLCVYDTSASVPFLAASLELPASSLWVNKDPKGFSYVDKLGTEDGFQKVQLTPGAEGRTKASVKAGGANMGRVVAVDPDRYFEQDSSIIVQLLNRDGLCLTSEFDVESVISNDAIQFKAKTR